MKRRRANGEGTIYYRKDGRWAAVVCLGRGKRKYLYRRSRAEAVLALQQANSLKLQGRLPGTRQTVSEFVLAWLEYHVQPHVRERTAHRYRELLTRHILPDLGPLPLQKLTPTHVQRLYQTKQQQGYAPRTILQIHRLLSRALADALRWHYVFYNVCQEVKVPRVPQKENSQPLTVEQTRQLLKASSDDPLQALYVLAVTTGMRQGELLALQWRDVDWMSRTLQVRRAIETLPKKGVVITELKTRSSRRCIPLPDLAILALQNHALRQQEVLVQAGKKWNHQGWIFCNTEGKPLDKKNLLRRSFRPLLRRAGLPQIRFHDLRHTNATLLLLLGVHPKVVQELLGHSQIQVTLDTYSHVLPPLQQEAMGRLHARLPTPFFSQ